MASKEEVITGEDKKGERSYSESSFCFSLSWWNDDIFLVTLDIFPIFL